MIDVNIDDFYHDVAVTLLSLYQQFPQKISLYIEDICGPDEIDEFGLHSPRYLSCIAALSWLHDEGYIRYLDIIKQDTAESCTLTQKAFVKLVKPNKDAASSSIERQRSTLAHQLFNAVQERSSIDIRNLIEAHFLES